MLYLVFISNKTGKKTKSTQVVRALTIGRGPAADIRLEDDERISRLHTLVVPRPDGRLELRDLSSTSGTYVMRRGAKTKLLPEYTTGCKEKGRATLAEGEKFFLGNNYTVEIQYEELLGEPTIQQIDAYSIGEEEDITGISEIDED